MLLKAGRSRPAKSLAQTDRLDSTCCTGAVSTPGETIAAFEQLQREERSSLEQLRCADLEAVWKIAGEGRLVCNQVLYHLSERAIEHAVIPWCEKHGVAVVAYSPFGHGGAFPVRATGGRVQKCRCWRDPSPDRTPVPGAALALLPPFS